jgi:hypothetical protein
MSGANPETLAPVATPTAAPVRLRDRLRLVALAGLVVLWVVPDWVEADVGGEYVYEKGAVRTGASAALALLALWGLSATSLAARTLRGLRVGAAWTDAVLAAATTGLLLAEHPWIPGGDIRAAWVPIFAPLALLAVLDALVVRLRRDAGYEISVIRAGAAIFAAGALVFDGSYIPAAVAAWLGVAPLMFLKLSTPSAARRSLEGFVLAAAAVVGFAPWIQKAVVGVHEAIGPELTWPLYLWCVTAALIVTTAVDGVMRPSALTPTSRRA